MQLYEYVPPVSSNAHGRASQRFQVRVHDIPVNDKLYWTVVEMHVGRRWLRDVSCLSLKGCIFHAYRVPNVWIRMPIIEIQSHYHPRFCINKDDGLLTGSFWFLCFPARVSEIPFIIIVRETRQKRLISSGKYSSA